MAKKTPRRKRVLRSDLVADLIADITDEIENLDDDELCEWVQKYSGIEVAPDETDEEYFVVTGGK